MKPMLLTATDEIPEGSEWFYETKYDGFRGTLYWEEKTPILKSRNGRLLNQVFPEIIDFCLGIYERVQSFLPLQLDGELVYLTNNFQSDFSIVQGRGRMRNPDSIVVHANAFPCHYVAFDILLHKSEVQTNRHLTTRKQILAKLFKSLKLPSQVNYEDTNRIQAIDFSEDSELLWNKIKVSNGEGIIAKKKTSKWIGNTRSLSWLKIKNWRYVDVILTKYDKSNSYFNGAIYQNDVLVEIVSFSHGLKEEEFKTLVAFIEANGTKGKGDIWSIEPSICVNIACIDFQGDKLREPRFNGFKWTTTVNECNWENMRRQLNPLPELVEFTHPEKPIWPNIDYTKDDYLYYLQKISTYMLPFLKDRLLTVIRYPHGVTGKMERFFQKHAPDYRPGFIQTKLVEDINYILCNDIESLLWLGNQLALEFHIPFQTIKTNKPTEIVFDLDPPSANEFSLAVEAALRMKAIFDQFELTTYIKTSGGKGMQVYIPLPVDTFSYEDTGVFTKFVCNFLVQQYPKWFTMERLKKNRGHKLYLDYIQHKEGKTIIAPYSPRGNELGLIATPLNWEEVNDALNPSSFTIPAVLERLQKQGDPFRNFREDINIKKFREVLKQLT
ncbi:DNA ligase D [Psychrobacillus sp. NEAU-3TGS]|uniref:DNA ligase D n=1 Tax=Psychrobacillus sp. NEAU-3TGS TaxID=2995412 RepID=UPI0024976DC1|nr:DNA ligase D [Psychrobacillus sp. NEAU-3TGS]MDI2589008.1 DNA ligase D [Psychrobacillus sp. NEAU-3TGS]